MFLQHMETNRNFHRSVRSIYSAACCRGLH